MIQFIDFEHPEKNMFRAVNQFVVEYTNNGKKENRRPDVLLFVNGMPLCVMELKNPADVYILLCLFQQQILPDHICYIPYL